MAFRQLREALEQSGLPPDKFARLFFQQRKRSFHIIRLVISESASSQDAQRVHTVLREGAEVAVSKQVEDMPHLPASRCGDHLCHPGIISVLREDGGEFFAISHGRRPLQGLAVVVLCRCIAPTDFRNSVVSARLRHDKLLGSLRHHTPNPPLVLPLAHVMAFDERLGEEARVVDPAAVNVADVDRAIGAGGEVHRAAPFVAAAEELGAVADACGFQARAVGRDLVARDELAGGIGDEDVVL